MTTIQIASYTASAALNKMDFTSSVTTSSYAHSSSFVNFQHCTIFATLEISSSTQPILGHTTYLYQDYQFNEAPITFVSESQITSTTFQQFIKTDYPSVFTRALLQDGVTIKLRSINSLLFGLRTGAISDYISF